MTIIQMKLSWMEPIFVLNVVFKYWKCDGFCRQCGGFCVFYIALYKTCSVFEGKYNTQIYLATYLQLFFSVIRVSDDPPLESDDARLFNQQ